MTPRRFRSGLAFLAGTLLLAACSDGHHAGTAAPTVTATTTTTAGTTASTATTATTAAGATAAAATTTPPAGAGTSPARDGDVDGDGRADDLMIPQPGVLRVDYAAGGADTVRFQTGNPEFVEIRVLGSADADRDGHAEVFVQVDQGASIGTATMFRYVDGHLRLVTLDGNQVALAYGGSTGYIATWACRPATGPGAAIVTAGGPSTRPNVYRLDLAYYRLQDTRLVPVSHETVGPAPLDELPGVRDEVSGTSGCGPARLTP